MNFGLKGRVRLMRTAKMQQSRRLPLGAAFETFVEKDDE